MAGWPTGVARWPINEAGWSIGVARCWCGEVVHWWLNPSKVPPSHPSPQVFVANPNKTRAVVEILFNNRDKLLKYLDDFHNDRGACASWCARWQPGHSFLCAVELLWW